MVQGLTLGVTVAADTGYIGGQGTKILNAVGTAKNKTTKNPTNQHTHTHTQNTYLSKDWASLLVQLVKNLPAMQETPVQFLGW